MKWEVSVRFGGKTKIYEYEGQSARYVINRIENTIVGEIIKIELIAE